MIIIRESYYSTAVQVGDSILNAAADTTKKTQSYYDDLFKNAPKTEEMVAIGSKSRMGSLEGIRNKAGVEEYGPKKVSTMDAHKLGQKSVSGLSGLKQWGSNTWNGMSKNQQLGAKIGAGALAAGTIYLGMKKLKKKKQENE